MVVLVTPPCTVIVQTCDDVCKGLGTLQTLTLGAVVTVAIVLANVIIFIAQIWAGVLITTSSGWLSKNHVRGKGEKNSKSQFSKFA